MAGLPVLVVISIMYVNDLTRYVPMAAAGYLYSKYKGLAGKEAFIKKYFLKQILIN